jgi:hypothetical protein
MLLHTIREMDAAVSSLLAQVSTRARLAPSPSPWRLALEVEREREALQALVSARLSDGSRGDLPELLGALESAAWRSQARRLARRGALPLARALLPENLPEVTAAAQGAAILEKHFLRPVSGGLPFPFEPHEMDAVAKALPATERAVQALWKRLEELEPSGRLERYLNRLARKSARRPGSGGPAVLLHADFWVRASRARLLQAVRELLPGFELRPPELLPVACWLGRNPLLRERPLVASAQLSENRAALIEFVAAWADVQRAPGRPDRWWQLEARGRRLDRVGSRGSRDAGREPLRRFVRLRVSGPATLPPEASVVGWVRAAWAVSSTEPAAFIRKPV